MEYRETSSDRQRQKNERQRKRERERERDKTKGIPHKGTNNLTIALGA